MRRKLALGWSLLLAGVLMVTAGTALALRQGSAPVDAPAWERDVVRLHVVANSDSEEDQALKRAVRDAILEEITPVFAGLTSQAEALSAIEQAIPNIEAAAARVISWQHQPYTVHARVGVFNFPGKSYGAFYLHGGSYRALRVEIGEARGANWWCVLFPPLCFVDWSTGLVLEPKPGTAGAETVSVRRDAQAAVRDEIDTIAVQKKTQPDSRRDEAETLRSERRAPLRPAVHSAAPVKAGVTLLDEERLPHLKVKARLAVVEWVKQKIAQRPVPSAGVDRPEP